MAKSAGEMKTDEKASVTDEKAFVARVQTDFFDPVISEIQAVSRQFADYSQTDTHIKTAVDKRAIGSILQNNIFELKTWELWRESKSYRPKKYAANVKIKPLIRHSTLKTIMDEIRLDNKVSGFDSERRCAGVVKEIRMAYDDVVRENEEVFEWNAREIDTYYSNIENNVTSLGTEVMGIIDEFEVRNSEETSNISQSIRDTDQYILELRDLFVSPPPRLVNKNLFAGLLKQLKGILSTIQSLKSIGAFVKSVIAFFQNASSLGARGLTAIALVVNAYLFSGLVDELIPESFVPSLVFIMIFCMVFIVAPFFLAWHISSMRENQKRPSIEIIVLYGFLGLIGLAYLVASVAYATRLGETEGAVFVAVLFGLTPFLFAGMVYALQYHWLIKSRKKT